MTEEPRERSFALEYTTNPREMAGATTEADDGAISKDETAAQRDGKPLQKLKSHLNKLDVSTQK